MECRGISSRPRPIYLSPLIYFCSVSVAWLALENTNFCFAILNSIIWLPSFQRTVCLCWIPARGSHMVRSHRRHQVKLPFNNVVCYFVCLPLANIVYIKFKCLYIQMYKNICDCGFAFCSLPYVIAAQHNTEHTFHVQNSERGISKQKPTRLMAWKWAVLGQAGNIRHPAHCISPASDHHTILHMKLLIKLYHDRRWLLNNVVFIVYNEKMEIFYFISSRHTFIVPYFMDDFILCIICWFTTAVGEWRRAYVRKTIAGGNAEVRTCLGEYTQMLYYMNIHILSALCWGFFFVIQSTATIAQTLTEQLSNHQNIVNNNHRCFCSINESIDLIRGSNNPY